MIESQFPEFYRKSDEYAKSWQTYYLWSERVELLALLVAAAAANVPGLRVLVVLGFGVSVLAHLFRLITKADEKWWNGRAGAESAKTICWKYVVGGNPLGIVAQDVDVELAARLTEIAAKVADLVPISVSQAHITAEMRAERAHPLDHRVTLYQRDRVQQQIRWYSRNSDRNGRLGRYWSWTAIAAQAAALLLGILGIANSWSLGFVGLLSALAASLVAWAAVKQFEFLARSYAVASNELSTIDVRISSTLWLESDWASFVNDAEEAISREHTSWRASRTV